MPPASGSSTKIAILSTSATLYTVMQWACWFSGQVVVPLSPKHPVSALEYFLADSKACCIITETAHEPQLTALATKLALPLVVVDHTLVQEPLPAPPTETIAAQIALQTADRIYLEGTQENAFYARNDGALILYTSGSTGPPKGTVLTHRNVDAQIASLRDAWQMTGTDSLLHVLPLNHVHGCVNALALPLSCGARVLAHRRFESAAVWSALLNVQQPSKERINVFMAVPTIYAMLIAEYDKVFAHNARMVDFIRSQCEKDIRLMVSGSAPLPAGVFRRWTEISGHRLLERYGMTECGMALSNPYRVDRVRERQPGRVGVPLPGTEVKLVSGGQTVCYAKGTAGRGWWSEGELPAYESAGAASESAKSCRGELYVKGPGVFSEYLGRPAETAGAFENGWFRTGDEVRFEGGTFQVLGRLSVDIIKTGGYKVSALEVETQMLDCPCVRDVCVIGVPDVTWGQRIAAVVQCRTSDADEQPAGDEQQRLDAAEKERRETLLAFCRERLASYQVPTEIRWVKELPRNSMGKVNKRFLLAELFGTASGDGGTATDKPDVHAD